GRGEDGRGDPGGGRDPGAGAGEGFVPSRAREEAEGRARAAEPAGEQVEGHLRLPHRLLDHRPAVVRAHLSPELGDRAVPRRRAGRLVVAGRLRIRRRLRILVGSVHFPPPRKPASSPAPSAAAAAPAIAYMRGSRFVVTTGSGGSP